MKLFVFIISFLVITSAMSARDIETTAEGGNWKSKNTWVGGKIPGSGDNAIIKSKVYINEIVKVKNITIESGGELDIRMDRKPNSYALVLGSIFLRAGSKLMICEECELHVRKVLDREEGAEIENMGVIEVGS